ncbi:hypothetical protein OXIME_000720 [Oxyplasma meridianum]|uniref:Uncharacterized protein n=1 Tax=Oxyplasma meridianum TaxID=3073602 RepID=A0AAX4NFV6_9ARCH
MDGKAVGKSILTNNYDNFSNKFAICHITITKPSILKRFKKMNLNKTINRQIKPFNFILVGNEVNDVIPCLPYTKDINYIQYNEFTDYKSGKSSNELDKPTIAYWKSLDNVLTEYVRHNDGKFDYINGIAQRKHITVDRIRYIGKESNNLDETEIFGIDDNSYIEYENSKKFMEWILSLRPRDVKEHGISRQTLYNIKKQIKNKNRQRLSKAYTELFKIFQKHIEK